MTTNRLEAFSDGVLAIVITIMVLEMKVPHGSGFEALEPTLPKFLSYVLSFVYVGIYWNNHHHLFHAIDTVNGKIMWANLLLLFFLSLIPFSTGWMGENHFDKNPVALYGLNLLFCAIAFVALEKVAKQENTNAKLSLAIENNNKEYLSIGLYILGFIISFYVPYLSMLIFAAVATIWLIPDTRIEKSLEKE
jgi:uncharacterized membrane protein